MAAIALSVVGCKTSETELEQPPFEHKDNVFSEVSNWYIDETWANSVSTDGEHALAQHSTSIWLDSIADIETIAPGEVEEASKLKNGASPRDGKGLRYHLNAAEKQGNALLQLVLHNLPGRGCPIPFTSGDLRQNSGERGFEAYKTHFFDRIKYILEDYPHIPVAVIVEPEAILSLARGYPTDCSQLSNQSPYGHTNSIRYVINTLSQLSNVHIYIDIGAANKLGWDEDLSIASLFMHGVLNGFDEQVALEVQAITNRFESSDRMRNEFENVSNQFVEPPEPPHGDTSPPGYEAIDGFASNVRDYVPLEEPFLGDPRLPKDDNPLMSALFYGQNPRVDEWTFTHDWLKAITALSPENTDHLGMIIDTSRNGWGQGRRRAKPIDTGIQNPDLVDNYRIDRREHRRNWCNQNGGLGKRPQPLPDGKHWIDAYVWATPPGWSDGNGVGHSGGGEAYYYQMCDPDQTGAFPLTALVTIENIGLGTGALPNAPEAGEWFSDGFKVLVKNAWPPVCDGYNDRCH